MQLTGILGIAKCCFLSEGTHFSSKSQRPCDDCFLLQMYYFEKPKCLDAVV